MLGVFFAKRTKQKSDNPANRCAARLWSVHLFYQHMTARRKRHIACDELFHFIAKLIARSFCCSSLPNRNRYAGLRFGFAASRRFHLQSPLCDHVLFCLCQKRTSSARSLAPPFQLRPAALGSQLAGRPAGGIFYARGHEKNRNHLKYEGICAKL